MYRSLQSSTQDTRDRFDLYSAQASFARPRVDLARLLRRAVSRPFRTIFSELSKSARFVSLPGKASLVSVSDAILFLRSYHVYFPLQFVYKSCVGKGWWRPRWHLAPPTSFIITDAWQHGLYLLSRVSFTDLFSIFPKNVRIVFLPHTNTVVLLERYSGTITETGLPVCCHSRALLILHLHTDE